LLQGVRQVSKRKILNVSLPEDLYAAVNEMVDYENKTKAELTREIIREYIIRQERWKKIRQWGKQTVEEMGITSEDELEDIIYNARKGH